MADNRSSYASIAKAIQTVKKAAPDIPPDARDRDQLAAPDASAQRPQQPQANQKTATATTK